MIGFLLIMIMISRMGMMTTKTIINQTKQTDSLDTVWKFADGYICKHISLMTNEFSPGRISMTVMLSQEFLPNLSTVLLQQVSNKSSHTFSKTVLPPHLQQFSGNKSLPNLSWNEYYQPIILVIMMFIIGISLHMMTDRTERELVTMSTLLQLGSNIEHRVAAWHRVPHLNIIDDGEDR